MKRFFLLKTTILLLIFLSFSSLCFGSNKNLVWFGFYSHPVCGDFESVKFHEFSKFVNVYVELCPDDKIVDKLKYLSERNIKASISLMPILFEKNKDNKWQRKANYVQIWNDFKNKIKDHTDKIHSFYLFDEPLVHNLSLGDLDAVSRLVKGDFPKIPTLIIESGAPQYLNKLPTLNNVDLLGINIYGYEPFSEKYWPNYINFRSRLKPNQRIILIADSWWDYQIHNFKNPMALMEDYYRLANYDNKIVGVFAFIWNINKVPPFVRSVGLREMPEVANSYIKWACQVTKRCKEINDTIKISHEAYLNDKPWSGEIAIRCIEKGLFGDVERIKVPVSYFYQPNEDKVCFYVDGGPPNSRFWDVYKYQNEHEIIFIYQFY